MKTQNEKLKTLLQRFVDDAVAEAMVRDIQEGDALLDRFSAPKLEAEASERICRRLAASGAAHRRRRMVFGITGAVASVIAVMLVISGSVDIQPLPVRPETQPVTRAPMEAPAPQPQVLVQYVWDDDFYGGEKAPYVEIKNELDNIADTIESERFKVLDISDQSGLNGDNAGSDEVRLDTTNFWKG